MWRRPQSERNDLFKIYCSKCGELCEAVETFSTSINTKCRICNNIPRFFRCKQSTCMFYESFCSNSCSTSLNQKSNKRKELPYGWNCSNSKSNLLWLLALVLVFLLTTIAFFYFKNTGNFGNEDVRIIEKLKRDYPLQINETWYQFLSMLKKEDSSVKSIIFLHSKEKATSDCLTKELVHLYTKNKVLNIKDITFSDFDADDYGFVLQHYLTVVQKFRVFVTDLNKVSGSVAKIFHSLCDEVSSEIKPSLFIFTLKYDERFGTMKPLERATFVLRNAWNQLPENELFPLLSRVVKNVVDVVPENRINC